MSKRRGHGEGAIYQRSDGRWVASVDLGWEAGRRRRNIEALPNRSVPETVAEAGGLGATGEKHWS